MKLIFSLGALALAAADPPKHPPALPAQWSGTVSTSKGVTTQQFSDGSAQKYATFASDGKFVVADCKAGLTYSNAPSGLIPGPAVCSLKPPDPYFDATCPGAYSAWPPAAADFYASYKNLVTYNKTMDCPATTGKRCDYYFHKGVKNTFAFWVVADTALPDSGSVLYSGTKYTHTFLGATIKDPTAFGRPAGCPDPSGACAICFTGQCAPCQACVGQAHGKGSQCFACWDDSASGFSCMNPAGAKDLCTECWKPSNNPPAPSPTVAPDAGTCGGSCASLGITGQCCPTATGKYLDCCAGTAPPAPAPTPAGDSCQTGPCGPSGECNACKACLSTQAGPCAPCWKKQPDGSACLPDCQDKCWSKEAVKVIKENSSIKRQTF